MSPHHFIELIMAPWAAILVMFVFARAVVRRLAHPYKYGLGDDDARSRNRGYAESLILCALGMGVAWCADRVAVRPPAQWFEKPIGSGWDWSLTLEVVLFPVAELLLGLASFGGAVMLVIVWFTDRAARRQSGAGYSEDFLDRFAARFRRRSVAGNVSSAGME